MERSPFSLAPLAHPAASSRVAVAGLLASLFSTVVLVGRGRTDAGSGAAPVNAISHWIWPVEAIQRDDVSVRHTVTGLAVHTASACMWAWLFDRLQSRRLHPTAADAVGDAIVVTTVAALVDLQLVPDRLTPGFQKRLQPSSTAMVYLAFAAGLALGGVLTRSGRR